MHDRADEYGRCTRALQDDRERPGNEAIFDQALTNGLAAIVARRWPGEEMDRNRVKSAKALLDVIAEHADEAEEGVVELPDLDPPPAGSPFGDDPAPTVVKVALLRAAIDVTQRPRHARLAPREPLGDDHVEALAALNADDSLRVSFGEFDLDEFEERVALHDAAEIGRARAYLNVLGVSEEWERREAANFADEFAEVEDHELISPVECPVCGLQALVPSGYDSYGREIAWGTCVACSYTKSFEVADLEGRDEALDDAINDPNR
jgi:hypothetical protein